MTSENSETNFYNHDDYIVDDKASNKSIDKDEVLKIINQYSTNQEFRDRFKDSNKKYSFIIENT